MKSKNIPILLFILVFAGVTLLGYTLVQAAINLGDGICSDQERQQNLCIRDCDYVIEVLMCDDGTWPCLETIGGVPYKVFRYRAQIAADATLPCDCDTWSYTVTQFEMCGGSDVDYIADSYPSGAALFISNCKVSKCADSTAPHGPLNYPELDWGTCNDGYEVWKLNPTLNCQEGGSINFEIRTPPNAGVSCGNPTWIRDRSGCTDSDNLLRGPGCDALPIDITSFTLGAFSAELDPCTGEPLQAYINGDPATEVLTWFSDNCNPAEPGATCSEVYPLTTTGPTSGCVFKSNPSRGCIGSRCFR